LINVNVLNNNADDNYDNNDKYDSNIINVIKLLLECFVALCWATGRASSL